MNTTELEQARHEAELNHVDYSRGSITPTADGYRVHIARPVVDVAGVVEPEQIAGGEYRSAEAAELRLLRGLVALHRAERRRVRLGRVVGWDTASICRVPLTEEELRDYQEAVKHAASVQKLRDELAEALARKADQKAQAAATQALVDRYGLKPAAVQDSDTKRRGRPAKAQSVEE